MSESQTPVKGIVYDVARVKQTGEAWRDQPSVGSRTKPSQTTLKEAIQMHKRSGAKVDPSVENESIEQRGSSADAAAKFKVSLETLDAAADEVEKIIDKSLDAVGEWMKDAASAQETLDKQVADAASDK